MQSLTTLEKLFDSGIQRLGSAHDALNEYLIAIPHRHSRIYPTDSPQCNWPATHSATVFTSGISIPSANAHPTSQVQANAGNLEVTSLADIQEITQSALAPALPVEPPPRTHSAQGIQPTS